MFGIGTILSIITGLGPSVLSIGSKIADYKLQKANTEVQKEKNKIDQEIAEANARRDVIVAEAGNRVAVLMKGLARGLIILGPVSYLIKISFWDKVVGSFVGCSSQHVTAGSCVTFATDPLNINLDATSASIIAAAVAFYLMYDIASISRRK